MGNRFNGQFGFNLFLEYNRFPLTKNKVITRFKANYTLKEQETEIKDKPDDSYNALLDAAWMYDDGEVHFKPMWFNLDEDKDKSRLKTPPGKTLSLETEQGEENRQI